MATAEPKVVPDEAPPAPDPSPSATPDEQAQVRRQPPYAVVLHNDANTFEYVIGVLRKVFHYGFSKAFVLTLQAHVGGRSVVWTGNLEVAELKADQIRSCGPDPEMKSHGALPLRVSVEPLPE